MSHFFDFVTRSQGAWQSQIEFSCSTKWAVDTWLSQKPDFFFRNHRKTTLQIAKQLDEFRTFTELFWRLRYSTLHRCVSESVVSLAAEPLYTFHHLIPWPCRGSWHHVEPIVPHCSDPESPRRPTFWPAWPGNPRNSGVCDRSIEGFGARGRVPSGKAARCGVRTPSFFFTLYKCGWGESGRLLRERKYWPWVRIYLVISTTLNSVIASIGIWFVCTFVTEEGTRHVQNRIESTQKNVEALCKIGHKLILAINKVTTEALAKSCFDVSIALDVHASHKLPG